MTVQKKYPIPTTQQEDIEEALGVVWHRLEDGLSEKEAIRKILEEGVSREIYPHLLEKDFLREENGKIFLTQKGEGLAKDITRRHRLAERLLSDTLSVEPSLVDPNACRMEHILSPEVSESICTLLGHPKECPHGSRIPPGECCLKSTEIASAIIQTLDRMSPGEEGAVAYLALRQHPELHRLLSLGLVPGVRIHLHQIFPSYVIELGETQLALEAELARGIYVRAGKS